MNQVNIIGRITKALELRQAGQSGTSIVSFSIAYNDKRGQKEETYFFDVTVWGKQAEIICQYFSKGQRIGVTGRLKQERFQDKNGHNRSNTSIVLSDFDFIEQRQDNGFNQQAPSGGGQQFGGNNNAGQQSGGFNGGQGGSNGFGGNNGGYGSDEVPF